MCESKAVPCNGRCILEPLLCEWRLHKSRDIKGLKTGINEENEI
jgi:hypothetical protein